MAELGNLNRRAAEAVEETSRVLWMDAGQGGEEEEEEESSGRATVTKINCFLFQFATRPSGLWSYLVVSGCPGC